MCRSASLTMRAIMATASTGYLPTADSPESITASVPSYTALATSETSARVGRGILDHRLQHLRRRDHRLEILRCAADDVLLNRRHLLRRNFDAQIAARHHDSVGSLQNAVEMLDGLRLFELGDDPGFAAVGRNAIAHQAHIFRGAHKRNRDRIHAVLQRELEVLRILFGQRRHAHRNARQVDALVFAQHAAVDDLANHVGADHFVHAQLDQSVGEQNARALLNVFRQRLESRAHQRCRSRNIARSDGQPPPAFSSTGW